MYKIYTKFLYAPPVHIYKWLLVMKLTTLILIISFMQVSAATFGQRIKIKQKDISIKDIFSEIKKQTGYGVFIRNNELNLDKKINANFNNHPIERVLKTILGVNYSYSIDDQVIVIKENEEINALEELGNRLKTINVSGKLVDEFGKPIVGATVKLRKSNGATTTNKDGEFTLKNVEEGDQLLITYIGYNAKEIPVSANIGTIKLELATSKLDEVIIQAYGKTSQRLSTANITTITAKQIENKPITNVLLALQGEVPGLAIGQVSGYANSGVSVQLRGLNSLTGANEPFYVIDGIPYESQMAPLMNGVGGSSSPLPGALGTRNAGVGNPLSFINPHDIESISVLKDADATSIYGSRAANGAIIITTKRANIGESRVNLMMQQGIGYISKFLDMMDTKQYLEMRKYGYYNTDGLTNASPEFASQYDINGTWDQNRYTDWQKELLGGKASYADYGLTFSGGNSFSNYRISGNYHRETNIFRQQDLNDQKASMQISLNHHSMNRRFNAQFTNNFLNDINKLPITNISQTAIQLPPNSPALYNDDNTLNWAQDINGTSTWNNPLAFIVGSKAETKTVNLVSNLLLSYELAKNLSLKANAGYRIMDVNEWYAVTSLSQAPEYRSSYKPNANFNRATTLGWILEPQLTYSFNLSKSIFELLAGATLQGNNMNQLRIEASNYANEFQLHDPRSAGSIRASSSNQTRYKYAGIFARLGYNYNSKYLLNLTARTDGSSKFGSNNLFHTFYSAAMGWIFSEEKLIKEGLPWLTFGKVRASYGSTGSDSMKDYAFMNLYQTYSAQAPYQGVVALETTGIPNPYLQWEETRKLDLGIELGFLKNRILISAAHYRNRSSNQLLSYDLPQITGFANVTRNLDATLQNSGLEFTINTKNIDEKNFSWVTNLNFTYTKNKLLRYPNLAQSAYSGQFKIGLPTTGIFTYNYAGVDRQTGLYQLYKSDGSLTSSDLSYPDDFSNFIDLLTRFSGGFTNNFSYRHFSLSFLFNFAQKSMKEFGPGVLPGFFGINQPKVFTNFWRTQGDISAYQKPSSTYATTSLSQYFTGDSQMSYKNVYYLRLRNVSFSYTLPNKFLRKVGIKDAQIFTNAQNIGTITNFNGMDPETGVYDLPPLQVITIGLRAGF